ncbi:uncharacterized protein LOC143200499 [Rhynchophorus ferrugineus]|uniref:uncharacterized protein LOC143200499 n=1 Tax=Rhynchophorus ferrugineus TaxID=354439 RepID=UPI003FCD6263
MNSFIFATLFAVLAVANAGVLVAPSAKIIQGPSTRTTVVGPDGSAISSVAPGGQIVQEEIVGVVAQTAPVVAAAPAVTSYVAAPSVLAAHSAPVVAYSSPIISAPLVSAYSAPVLSGVVAKSVVDTVVAGPSGSIVTGKTVAAPVVAPLVSTW